MTSKPSSFALESGLDLGKVVTTGSILQINDVYDEGDYAEPDRREPRHVDILGKPVPNFAELEKTMYIVDVNGYVKKKIIEEGGGLPLYDVYTVSVAFSGYWENDLEPFDSRKLHKPLVVDLKENGLLPGLQLAIRSMLVGETSLFLFSHQVMYGEMGIPPRIRPKSKCAFYIKLIKSILTPRQGQKGFSIITGHVGEQKALAPNKYIKYNLIYDDIDFSEPNMFERVRHEARMLYSSGGTLYRTNNFPAAIQLFRKAVSVLHRCRLANENEEKQQEKLLIKLYLNLAVCYNKTKQPLKACTVCNELNRLSSLWNNYKALFQNAKALRMIGEFEIAEKRLKRAIKLHRAIKVDEYGNTTNPKEDEAFAVEIEALCKARKACNQTKLIQKVNEARSNLVSDEFKEEVDRLIKNFKENSDMCKLIMPTGLNSSEVKYIRETCVRENLFFNKVRKEFSLEDEENVTNVKNILNPEENYALDKFDDRVRDPALETENFQERRNENRDKHYNKKCGSEADEDGDDEESDEGNGARDNNEAGNCDEYEGENETNENTVRD